MGLIKDEIKDMDEIIEKTDGGLHFIFRDVKKFEHYQRTEGIKIMRRLLAKMEEVK